MIEIDGTRYEGGGQILRNSLALAAITRTPVKISNIRANRASPGIRPQHYTAINAIAKLMRAEVINAEIGSTYLEFFPKNNRNGSFYFDARTAASTALILQSLLPIMAFSRGQTRVKLQGGTNVPWAPSIEYIQRTLLPSLRQMGLTGSVELVRRGFYPKGGGIIIARTEPIRYLHPIVLQSIGKIQKITGLCYSSRLPCHIVQRIVHSINKSLQVLQEYPVDIQLECLQHQDKQCALSAGCGAILTAECFQNTFFSREILGERGKPAEKVGQELAENFLLGLKNKAPIDKYLGDQLIIYMALAKGRSQIQVEELTAHTLSSIYVSTVITGARFHIEGKKGSPATIKCKGVGVENPFL